MNILVIIPARYGSTRFPGKALADIGGKTMVRRVYEQACKADGIKEVVVATDDERIMEEVASFGGKAYMTDTKHQSGTDRCFEALQLHQDTFDYVINLQGDEPFISPEQINLLVGVLDRETELATLIKKIEDEEELFNPNVVKVILNQKQEAIYFSRATLPYQRNFSQDKWLSQHVYYKHIGIYAYRCDVLKTITKLEVSSLEKAESLEQLRWLEHGYKIKVAETKHAAIGVDTPEDLEKLKAKYAL